MGSCAPVPFHHEALLYATDDEFLAATVPFIRDGVRAGEPVLVVVREDSTHLLRGALGDDADAVTFADMDEVGANPARIIPAWQEFVTAHAGRPMRGIGEPIRPGRTAQELVECHRHEALLNVAFAETPGFTLLCPYDTGRLDPAVIAEAHRTHPHVRTGGRSNESLTFAGADAAAAPFGVPLPDPPAGVEPLPFHGRTLAAVRSAVWSVAAEAGVDDERAADLVLAVSEVAGNSVRHGGGRGVLLAWAEEDAVVCEVRDRGNIADPLAGRRRPAIEQIGGYGLWLANQVCELVQVRSTAEGGVVRLHLRRQPVAAPVSRSL